MAQKPDISKLTTAQLKQLITDAEKIVARKTKEQMAVAKKAAEKAAKEHGFSLDEIVGKPKSKGTSKSPKKAPPPPKYKNLNNHSETWSGRGRQPEWYKEAIAGGKKPEDMAV